MFTTKRLLEKVGQYSGQALRYSSFRRRLRLSRRDIIANNAPEDSGNEQSSHFWTNLKNLSTFLSVSGGVAVLQWQSDRNKKEYDELSKQHADLAEEITILFQTSPVLKLIPYGITSQECSLESDVAILLKKLAMKRTQLELLKEKLSYYSCFYYIPNEIYYPSQNAYYSSAKSMSLVGKARNKAKSLIPRVEEYVNRCRLVELMAVLYMALLRGEIHNVCRLMVKIDSFLEDEMINYHTLLDQAGGDDDARHKSGLDESNDFYMLMVKLCYCYKGCMYLQLADSIRYRSIQWKDLRSTELPKYAINSNLIEGYFLIIARRYFYRSNRLSSSSTNNEPLRNTDSIIEYNRQYAGIALCQYLSNVERSLEYIKNGVQLANVKKERDDLDRLIKQHFVFSEWRFPFWDQFPDKYAYFKGLTGKAGEAVSSGVSVSHLKYLNEIIRNKPAFEKISSQEVRCLVTEILPTLRLSSNKHFDVMVVEELSETYLLISDPDSALKALKYIPEDCATVRMYVNQGRAYSMKGDLLKANECLKYARNKMDVFDVFSIDDVLNVGVLEREIERAESNAWSLKNCASRFYTSGVDCVQYLVKATGIRMNK